MSNQGRQRSVHCLNDCRREGCPGHTITLTHHHTSGTVSIMQDGAHWTTFDAGIWRALVNMEAEMHDPPVPVPYPPAILPRDVGLLLSDWTEHHATCERRISAGNCDCGLDDIMAEIGAIDAIPIDPATVIAALLVALKDFVLHHDTDFDSHLDDANSRQAALQRARALIATIEGAPTP